MKSGSTDFLVIHNLLWTPYKGAIYGELNKQARTLNYTFKFVHIAETSGERRKLSPVDLSYHAYPYTVLFPGTDIEDVGQISLAVRLIRLIRATKPRVVLIPGYDSGAFWIALLYCALRGLKVVSSLDSTEADRPRIWPKELPKRVFYKFVDSVVCYGQRSAAYLKKLGVPPASIVSGCQAVPQRSTARKEEWKREGRLEFLYVGRLAPEKNLNSLLQAFAALSHQDDRLHLKLIGSGGQEDSLKHEAHRLGLDRRITWVPGMPTRDLERHYDAAYALVLPSTSEPWGLVVNEAFQSNCPAVVTEICGCVPELISEGETGWISADASVDTLKGALKRAIDAAGSRQEIGENCAARVAKFSPRAAAEKMVAAYQIAAGK